MQRSAYSSENVKSYEKLFFDTVNLKIERDNFLTQFCLLIKNLTLICQKEY